MFWKFLLIIIGFWILKWITIFVCGLLCESGSEINQKIGHIIVFLAAIMQWVFYVGIFVLGLLGFFSLFF